MQGRPQLTCRARTLQGRSELAYPAGKLQGRSELTYPAERLQGKPLLGYPAESLVPPVWRVQGVGCVGCRGGPGPIGKRALRRPWSWCPLARSLPAAPCTNQNVRGSRVGTSGLPCSPAGRILRDPAGGTAGRQAARRWKAAIPSVPVLVSFPPQLARSALQKSKRLSSRVAADFGRLPRCLRSR